MQGPSTWALAGLNPGSIIYYKLTAMTTSLVLNNIFHLIEFVR